METGGRNKWGVLVARAALARQTRVWCARGGVYVCSVCEVCAVCGVPDAVLAKLERG